MMESSLWVYASWAILAVLKFVITPSTMIGVGMDPWETFWLVGFSASVGFTLFYFFGDAVFTYMAKHRKRPARRFTRVNRTVIGMKLKYGLVGMGLIAGVISVPLAGLLTARYFRNPWKAIPAIILSFFLWTALLTGLSWWIRHGVSNAI